MATQKFYRVVNGQFEKVQNGLNTVLETAKIPDRKTAKSFFPLFQKVWNLWEGTNCQLPTANALIMEIIRNKSFVNDSLNKARMKGETTISSTFLKDAKEDITLPIVLLEAIFITWHQCPLLCPNHIRHFWEFAWENTRKMFAPSMPSRLDSLYIFDNLIDAQVFISEWGVPSSKILEVVPTKITNLKAVDKNLFDEINHNVIRYKDFLNIAKLYWSMGKSSCPKWEYLFQGEYNTL